MHACGKTPPVLPLHYFAPGNADILADVYWGGIQDVVEFARHFPQISADLEEQRIQQAANLVEPSVEPALAGHLGDIKVAFHKMYRTELVAPKVKRRHDAGNGYLAITDRTPDIFAVAYFFEQIID